MLTSEQFKKMTADFRKVCGYADMIINDAQTAFGTLDNVVKFSPAGNIWLADGTAYIHNLNKLYPTLLNLSGGDNIYISELRSKK